MREPLAMTMIVETQQPDGYGRVLGHCGVHCGRSFISYDGHVCTRPSTTIVLPVYFVLGRVGPLVM